MKDKIIEILEKFVEICEKEAIWDKVGQTYYNAKSILNKGIDAPYPTINRDKVRELLWGLFSQIQEAKTTGEKYHYLEKTYDALCSLSLPTLSEGEVEKSWNDHKTLDNANIVEWMTYENFKAALNELTKPKEE